MEKVDSSEKCLSFYDNNENELAWPKSSQVDGADVNSNHYTKKEVVLPISDCKEPFLDNALASSKNCNREKCEETKKTETVFVALRQLIIPFLVSGCGNVAAGVIFHKVQYWQCFEKIPQFFILVPALLGLKGNVEVMLASRLSTYANLGYMDNSNELRLLIIGNLALVQCQASVVGFVASLLAILLSLATDFQDAEVQLNPQNILIITASSVVTTNLANLLLGSLMCIVIILCRKVKINPDNLAAPVASSLGDVTTIVLLAYIRTLLASLLILTPVWAIIARKNKFTRSKVITGWLPIMTAMIMQTGGGMIMKSALETYDRIAAFQPVINGVAGSLAGIQTCRMSTYLHLSVPKRQLPKKDPKAFIIPFSNFFNKSPHANMAKVLFLISGPSHILFLFVIRAWKMHFSFTLPFICFYLFSTGIQVALLLYIGYCLVLWLWKRGMNPDTAIPFLTAFSDLIGSGLLALAFFLLDYFFKDVNASNLTIK